LGNSEFELIISTARQIAREKIAPRAAEIDEKHKFPDDVLDLFKEYGLLGLPIPEEYEGVGVPTVTFCEVVSEIAKVCASSSMILANQSLGSSPIVLFGNSEQKEKYLPAMALGDILPAFALTEPEAGSDVKNIKTTATKTDGGYIVTGSKIFITGGSVADVFSVFAKARHGSEDRGLSVFILEKDMPGVRIGRDEEKMGLRGSPTTQLFFDNVFVSDNQLLGKEGQGFEIALAGVNKGRIVSSSQAIGLARGSLEAALEYSSQRVQFNRPISDFQAVQAMISDMNTDIEAAWSLLLQAANKYDEKSTDMALFSSMCKLFASEMVLRVTSNAVQIHGGYGYTRDYPVERMMRDSKVFAIFEGTSQIQRTLIARQLIKK